MWNATVTGTSRPGRRQSREAADTAKRRVPRRGDFGAAGGIDILRQAVQPPHRLGNLREIGAEELLKRRRRRAGLAQVLRYDMVGRKLALDRRRGRAMPTQARAPARTCLPAAMRAHNGQCRQGRDHRPVARRRRPATTFARTGGPRRRSRRPRPTSRRDRCRTRASIRRPSAISGAPGYQRAQHAGPHRRLSANEPRCKTEQFETGAEQCGLARREPRRHQIEVGRLAQ